MKTDITTSFNPETGEIIESETTVISVEQLNLQIRQIIEGEFQVVWVRGELSNFKPHTSGHYYFSLKDSKSQIKAVMFRGYNSKLKFKPHDGLEVIVRGKVTVYEPRGDYQISVESMEPVGAGALQKAFEQLKHKLKNEGLFELARKRPLPKLPQHVVIVTSPTGAAIRDMINVLTRRYRAIQITIVPTIVQGEAAAPLICEALQRAYRIKDAEVIIVGRGGGSIEDMWCFNSEAVARQIAASPIPIVSAVGHEIDFTIADFVADVRAPTPSAAAELVVKNAQELNEKVLTFKRMLGHLISRFLRTEKQKVLTLQKSLIDPKQYIFNLMQKNDDLSDRLELATNNYIEKKKYQINLLQQKLISPEQVFLKLKNKLILSNTKLRNTVLQSLEQAKKRFEKKMVQLDSLSPLKVVERGYSIVKRQDTLIKDSGQLKQDDELSITFAKGQALVKVIKKES